MSDTDQAIKDIYQKVLSPLSVGDRIQLAALILNGITEKNIEVIESSDTWTEQDLVDITSFSLPQREFDRGSKSYSFVS